MGKAQTPVTESGISNPNVAENSAHIACMPRPNISDVSNVTGLVHGTQLIRTVLVQTPLHHRENTVTS